MDHDVVSRAEELRACLKVWRDAYYNLTPVVPDPVYDSAKDELARLEPSDPEVTAVGAPPPQFSLWEKVVHEIPMGSLGKVNSLAEFREWVEKTGSGSFFYTHKIDGSSMELVYDGGRLVRAVTRGDGTVGEDVLSNVSQVPDVPQSVPVSGRFIVRGEVVMLKSVFQAKYAGEYANPRNTAAARVREKKSGGASCADLSFVAFWTGPRPDRPDTMLGIVTRLHMLGFRIPTNMGVWPVRGIEKEFDCTKESRDDVPYEIDGMVVSVNDMTVMDELGDLNMRPRGQVAWKFDAAMCETRVTDVRWQIGPTGRITPVAVLEPVNIGGVVITNVSLHNLIMFADLKLSRGCRVLVSRRNDVIPYIEQNLDLVA